MYNIVEEIEQATHWIPCETSQSSKGFITVGKPYRIHHNEIRDEYFMFDDMGHNSQWFDDTEGYFVRLEEENEEFLNYEEVKKLIKAYENKLNEAKKRLTQVCPHKNIKHGEKSTDILYKFPDWYMCKDCGLHGHSEQDDLTNYNLLKEQYELNNKGDSH